MEIIPAILEKEWGAVQVKLDALEGKSDWAQIDVSDGEFTPHKTWGNPDDLWARRNDDIHIELHLMIARPWEDIQKWLRSGADRFVVHIEAFLDEPENLDHVDDVLSVVQDADRQVGLALNPSTEWSVLERYMAAVEHILFLGVEPGASGQKFNQNVVGKITALRGRHKDVTIAVDGGVNDTTVGALASAGADRLISSSFIFSHSDPAKGIEALKEAVERS